MVEIVQIIWVLSLVVLLVIAACVQLYDQKRRKKPMPRTDTRSVKEAALREAASQSFRLNLMAMDAARKMSETAARHAKNSN